MAETRTLRLNDLKLPLDHSEADLRRAVVAALGVSDAEIADISVFKRSYDARKKTAILLIYSLDVALSEAARARVLAAHPESTKILPSPDTTYKFVAHAPEGFPLAGQQRPIIIGFGPCGILAALIMAQMGLKPIVLERGQNVRIRTQDTWGLWRKKILNTESNVQFGEGGAGTFSDGKLWSQIQDKHHYGRKVLTEFVKAGAPEEIQYVSKPHIGTFKL
ncbi:MAG: hypothetical protein ACOVKN_08950, partial [Arenimonas sp.]